VTGFYHAILMIGYVGVVVWDWNDVPLHPHMHWDATIFVGGLPHRIEVDGPIHDLINAERVLGDVMKDQAVIETPGLSVLRLKHQDCVTWPQALMAYIGARLQFQIHGVWGTAWYMPFQYPGQGPMLGYVQII
jgi:hypothetical protein